MIRRIFASFCLGVAASACSSNGTTATPTVTPDASPPTDAGDTQTPQFSDVDWSAGPELLNARDHHASFVMQAGNANFLYVAGGRQLGAGITSSIERSRIANDGSLGEWENAGQLASAVGGHAVAQRGKVVALIGGTEKSKSSTKVSVGLVNSEGDIRWTAGPSLSVPRFHGTAAVIGKFVYVFGGFPDNARFVGTDVIERAEFDDTGLSDWTVVGQLPSRYTHQATVAFGKHVYLISGTPTAATPSNEKSVPDILHATAGDDGTLSAWTKIGALPAPRSTHAATVVGTQLIVAGGSDVASTIAYDDVWISDLRADGSLSAFRAAQDEPLARMHLHHAPALNGRIYFAGGMSHEHAVGEKSESRVDIATLR